MHVLSSSSSSAAAAAALYNGVSSMNLCCSLLQVRFTQHRYIMEDVGRQWTTHDIDQDGMLTWPEYRNTTYGPLTGKARIFLHTRLYSQKTFSVWAWWKHICRYLFCLCMIVLSLDCFQMFSLFSSQPCPGEHQYTGEKIAF